MRWMKANPGQRPPRAIKELLDQSYAFEELKLQQQDQRILAEWEADQRPVEEKGPPPVADTRRVIIPPKWAKGIINALAEQAEEEKANAPVGS